MSGISKSQVSKLCKDIDERVNGFLGRALEGDWPYLWLDATSLKVRAGGRILGTSLPSGRGRPAQRAGEGEDERNVDPHPASLPLGP